MTITLAYALPRDIVEAAQFCAELARQGVRFTAKQTEHVLVVTLTGGF